MMLNTFSQRLLQPLSAKVFDVPKQSRLKIQTQSKLCELFDYVAQTGDLIWRERPRKDFKTDQAFKSWNLLYPGKIAGHVKSNGYREIGISRTLHIAHRCVWIMHYGPCDDKHIDHINHNRSDNRIENLRVVTVSQNQQNASMRIDNKSGVTGVIWNKANSKWLAVIRVNGKNIYLGSFDQKNLAIEARSHANAKFGFHCNHGIILNSPKRSTP